MQYYSFEETVLNVNGVQINGFSEGDDVIGGDRRVDAFTGSVGADGRMIVAKNADRSGLIEIKLQIGSASNTYLSGLFALQEKGDVFAAVSVVFKNIVNSELVVGTKGFIVKPAPLTRGTNPTEQTWQVVVEDYDAIFATLPEVAAG